MLGRLRAGLFVFILVFLPANAPAYQDTEAASVREHNEAARYYIDLGDYEVAARHLNLSRRALRRAERAPDGDALVISTNLLSAEIEFIHLGNAHRMDRYASEAFERLEAAEQFDIQYAEAALYKAFDHFRDSDYVEAAYWFRVAQYGFVSFGMDGRADLFARIAIGFESHMHRRMGAAGRSDLDHRLANSDHLWVRFFDGAEIGHARLASGRPQAEPINRQPPAYPQGPLYNGIMGFVVLEFDVDTHGTPQNVEVLYGTPQGVFDSAAVAAIQRWRYRPMLDANNAPQWDHDLRTLIDFTFE
jgi:TonB family protein